MELWGRKNAYNLLKLLWIPDEQELDYQHHEPGSNLHSYSTGIGAW